VLFRSLSSSITSSLATANVVTGYLGRPEDPHSRLYRFGMVAMATPAVLLIMIGLNAYRALILSQVVLSLQLPLTIIPLLILTRRKTVMGELHSGTVSTVSGWLLAAIIIGLNVFLLYQTFSPKGL
jgi:manganese transport protein